MVTYKVHLSGSVDLPNATLPAPPHVGEFIWFSDEKGAHRTVYKIENVVHAYHGEEVDLFVKTEATPFFKQWND